MVDPTLRDQVHSITVRDLFRRAFRVFPDRLAVASESSTLSYRELGERSGRLAGALHARGVTRGTRVAVLSETRPEYIEWYAALAELGAVLLTLNIRLHPRELADLIHRGAPAIVVGSGTFAAATDLARQNSTVDEWVCLDDPPAGWTAYRDLLAKGAQPPPECALGSADIHNVLYTSGTTGPPKGAMISQGAAATRGLRLAQWFGLTESDGFVGWLPLFHCGGDESLYATLVTGGTYATFPKADAEAMFRMIERHRLTWTLLLPGVITDVLDHPRRGDYDLSSWRFAIGYANMMPAVVQRLTAELGIAFYDAFGQTETSYLLAHGISSNGEAPSLRKTPSPLMDVRIVDADLNELPSGTPGECVVRGPSVMSGYLDDPEASAAAFRGGWLHTGDLLVRHDDGTLSFVDRSKCLVKSGGENVYPAEVELVLIEHPAVQEVAVFGVPDERWGETVKAAVVTRPGANVTREELDAWCRDRLSGYKRPRYYAFMAAEEIPRSTTGKLQRHELAKHPVTADERV